MTTFLIWITLWLSTQLVITSQGGTLLLVGGTPHSIVLAGDSAVYQLLANKDEALPRGVRKMVPIGTYSVCFIAGTETIALRDGAKDGPILDQVQFLPMIKEWAKHNPNARTREAYEALKAQIESTLKRYQDKYGISDAKLGGSLTSFGCVGYDMGTPVLIATDFHAPTEHELKETLSDIVLPPGMLIALGANAVSYEIMKPKTTRFTRYTDQPPAVAYRKPRGNDGGAALTTDNLLGLSRLCLEATESSDGKQFDPEAAHVSPPNYFAVIDEKSGFRWVK